MDLQDFIKETLVHISQGISAANEALSTERKKADGSDLPASPR